MAAIRPVADRPWPATNSRILRLLDQNLPDGPYRRHLRQVIEQGADSGDGTPGIGALPFLTCAASGGDPGQAAPVAAAWRLTRLAAKLLDDVEDGEAGDQAALQTNVATGLLCAIQLLLGELRERRTPAEAVWQVSQALSRALLRACAGQHADLVAAKAAEGPLDLDAWLDVATAKSGELFAWAAWAGAFVAGADEQARACFWEYGRRLGVLAQVADDFKDVWQPNNAGDLRTGRLSLPVCYALSVTAGSDREWLEALRWAAAEGDAAAEAELREALSAIGAQAYLLVFARLQYWAAAAALRRLAPGARARSQPLITLLERVLPALRAIGG